jgi:RimJ/RimL family protein N-acetyltransferase
MTLLIISPVKTRKQHAGLDGGRISQPKMVSAMRSGAGHSWETGGPTRTFATRDAATSRLLGGCELRVQPDGSAHVSYWTSAGERRRGYATRALALLLHYGNSIGVTRFEAHIAPDNLASRRVSEKTGFRCVGRFTDEEGAVMIKYEQRSNI